MNIRLLDPQQTSNGAQATANSGGLVVSLIRQFAIPFIPGEPTIPIPMLGNVGLPAGDYTMTTSVTFGLAEATVDASAPRGEHRDVGEHGGRERGDAVDLGVDRQHRHHGQHRVRLHRRDRLGPEPRPDRNKWRPDDADTRAEQRHRVPDQWNPTAVGLDGHRVVGVHPARLPALVAGTLAVRSDRKDRKDRKETTMTLDVDKNLEDIFRSEEAGTPKDGLDVLAPEAGAAPEDGDRQDDGGGSGGGGHTRMARWAEKYDIRNGWQVIAGAILIPLGVVFILLGWYGAAHARVVQQQIPYMVSGSFVGLGCMIVGGLLFWGHWLYRIYDQADLHHEEQQRVLETIAAALLAGRGVESSGVAAGLGVPAGGGAAGAGTPGPTTYCDRVGNRVPPGGLRGHRAPFRRPARARA